MRGLGSAMRGLESAMRGSELAARGTGSALAGVAEYVVPDDDRAGTSLRERKLNMRCTSLSSLVYLLSTHHVHYIHFSITFDSARPDSSARSSVALKVVIDVDLTQLSAH